MNNIVKVVKLLSKKSTVLFCLAILSLPAIYYLLIPGFYEPHDLHHVADIYEMYRSFVSGQMPPRLGPDFLYGFGYPLFNFYYVLPFYIGAFYYFITGSLTGSFEFVFILSAALSIFGMYLLLKEFLSPLSAIVGSILYLYTPYRAVQMYVRGAMGEAFAMSLMPFVMWSLVKLVKKRNLKNIALSSTVLSLFIFSHNYLWALSAPVVVLFIFLTSSRKKFFESVVGFLYAGFLAIGITCYWWLPALLEQGLVSDKTPFPLIDHFPFIKQLLLPSWGYGSSVWGPGDEISFQIGIVNLFVFALGVLVFIFTRKKLNSKIKSLIIWSVSVFTICFIFMNIRTFPIWQVIPFHDFIQFPWRLLIFTTLATAVLAGVLVELVKDPQKRLLLGITLLAITILFNFSYFKPSKIVQKSDQDYLTRMFANRTESGASSEVSSAYRHYSEDYLLLPKGVTEKPNYLPENRVELDKGVVKLISEESPIKWTAKVTSEEESEVIIHLLNFPGWEVKLNNYSIPTSSNIYGAITFTIPSGSHEISVNWTETPLRKTADVVSLFSLTLLGLLLVLKRKAT